MNLKVLSYNIHKGFNWNNQKYFLQEIKSLIQQSNADLVFLQEVVGKNQDYQKQGLIDAQFEFLADSIWSHHSYGANSIYDHGHHGNLILSKFPLESWENIDISTNLLEKRGLLVCKVKIPNTNITVNAACAHLDLLHRGRAKQYQMIKNKVLSMDLQNNPLIVAGDFNDWNQKSQDVFESHLDMHEAYKFTHGRLAKTFPAAFPFMCLDRIYVKNVEIISAEILQTAEKFSFNSHFSDHLPLVCELKISETKSYVT